MLKRHTLLFEPAEAIEQKHIEHPVSLVGKVRREIQLRERCAEFAMYSSQQLASVVARDVEILKNAIRWINAFAGRNLPHNLEHSGASLCRGYHVRSTSLVDHRMGVHIGAFCMASSRVAASIAIPAGPAARIRERLSRRC